MKTPSLNTIKPVANNANTMLDSITSGIGSALKTLNLPWYQAMGVYFLAPITLFCMAFGAIMSWDEYRKNPSSGNLFQAFISTLFFTAVAAAIIGGLFFAAAFGLASPIIFTVVVGLSALIQAGKALYSLGKMIQAHFAAKVPDPTLVPQWKQANKDGNEQEKARLKKLFDEQDKAYLDKVKEYNDYRIEFRNNTIQSILNFALMGAIITVSVLGHVHLAAAVGIPVAAATTLFAGYKIVENLWTAFSTARQTKAKTASQNPPQVEQTPQLHDDEEHQSLLATEKTVSNSSDAVASTPPALALTGVIDNSSPVAASATPQPDREGRDSLSRSSSHRSIIDTLIDTVKEDSSSLSRSSSRQAIANSSTPVTSEPVVPNTLTIELPAPRKTPSLSVCLLRWMNTSQQPASEIAQQGTSWPQPDGQPISPAA